MLLRTRISLWSLGLCLVGVAVCAGAEPIFPSATGTTWEFGRQGVEPAGMTRRIAGHENVDGKDLIKLETVIGDVVVRTEMLSVENSGVFCHQRTGHDGRTLPFDPPLTVIPWPLQVGTKWELEDEVAGSPMHQQFTVVSEEDVVVPAGSFHAFHLRCEQPWPISVTIERWFAPGVGYVKDVTTTHGPTGRLLGRVVTVLNKLSVVAPTPGPSATPTPTPTAAPEFALSPRAAKITLKVAKTRDGEAQTEFRTDAPEIFVSWSGENLPLNSYVRVAWVAADVGGIVDPNFVIDEKQTEITRSDLNARFTLSRPADGWAAGKYRLELYLDDQLMETVPVTIHD
jgi:hypothetical protein